MKKSFLDLHRNVGELYRAETILKDAAYLGCFLWDIGLLGQESTTAEGNPNKNVYGPIILLPLKPIQTLIF